MYNLRNKKFLSKSFPNTYLIHLYQTEMSSEYSVWLIAILAGIHLLCSMAVIMDVLNDPDFEYLPNLNEDKPPELIDFELQVHKANDHFSAIRNDIIRWYLSPPESCSYPKSVKKKTNKLLNNQFCIIIMIMQRTS